MSKRAVGFVGLGLMGKPMARRFLAAGYPLAVSSRSRPPVDEIAAEGARACGSPAGVAAHSEIVFTMLPDAPNLKDVVFAENGLLGAMKPGGVLVDCTSNDPAFSAEVAEALSEKGVGMLDAPVSGAPEGAAGGTLAIMAGGPRDVFTRCKPLLDVLGAKVVHVGEPAGSGCIAKLANQILVAVTFLGVGEALVFGAKAGLDPAALVDVMGSGLARCGGLEVKAPKILSGDFSPGGKITSHVKDLRYALEQAREREVALPGASLVAQIFNSLVANGEGELDHIAIVKVLERMAGVEARALS